MDNEEIVFFELVLNLPITDNCGVSNTIFGEFDSYFNILGEQEWPEWEWQWANGAEQYTPNITLNDRPSSWQTVPCWTHWCWYYDPIWDYKIIILIPFPITPFNFGHKFIINEQVQFGDMQVALANVKLI